MLMMTRRATLIVAGFAGMLAFLPGCASVKCTSACFTPTSIRVYPTNPLDAAIPIPSTPPRSHLPLSEDLRLKVTVAGVFLRKSMVYNAQLRGARAVILKSATSRREVSFERTPPRVDWAPMLRRSKNDKVHGRMVSFVRPGYVQRSVNVITAIDAEMIVLEK